MILDPTKTVTLEMKKVAVRALVDDMQFVAANAELDVYRDSLFRLGLQLRSFVLTNRLDFVEKSEWVQVPDSWWDHFKQEQVGAASPLWRWVARRWPPKYRTVKVTARAEVVDAYPNASISVPSLGTPVRMVVPA